MFLPFYRKRSINLCPVSTGEEDEEVETEIKGAKVFIKRGDRDFCEGILGNVKLLKHKETGDHRIREFCGACPDMQPLTRCCSFPSGTGVESYDECPSSADGPVLLRRGPKRAPCHAEGAHRGHPTRALGHLRAEGT